LNSDVTYFSDFFFKLGYTRALQARLESLPISSLRIYVQIVPDQKDNLSIGREPVPKGYMTDTTNDLATKFVVVYQILYLANNLQYSDSYLLSLAIITTITHMC
jgi:hypothetical protein